MNEAKEPRFEIDENSIQDDITAKEAALLSGIMIISSFGASNIEILEKYSENVLRYIRIIKD